MASFDDILASCIIGGLSGVAFSAYVLASCAIYRVRKATKNPFYLLLLALGVSDSTMLALFLFYSTSATLLQRSPLGSEFDSLICGTLCNITYFTSLALLVSIALDRYFSVCSKVTSKRIYEKKRIRFTIFGCFAFGVISAIAQMTPCCSLRYYEKEYAWSYDLTLEGNRIFVWFDRSVNMITFLCLLVSYTLIFKKVRKTQNAAHPSAAPASSIAIEQRKQKIDTRLALQSALVAGVMITFGLGFTIIPLVTSSKWWNLCSSILYTVAVGVHPFVYISFNKQIRRQVRGLLKCKRIHDAVTEGSPYMGSVFIRAEKDHKLAVIVKAAPE